MAAPGVFGFEATIGGRLDPSLGRAVDAANSRLDALEARARRLNLNVGGGIGGVGAGALGGAPGNLGNYAALERRMGSLNNQTAALSRSLGQLTNFFSGGLGIGATIGAFALLERTFNSAIKKAQEYQTALLSIAAARQTSFDIVGSNGTFYSGPKVSGATEDERRFNRQLGFQASLTESKEINRKLIRRAELNTLSYKEQLDAFRVSTPIAARKGMSTDEQIVISERLAMIAKSLGLSGQQQTNQVRVAMAGRNIPRSILGSQLDLDQGKLQRLKGKDYVNYLMNATRGYEGGAKSFDNSIESLFSTISSRSDQWLARIGTKFVEKNRGKLEKMMDFFNEGNPQGQKMADNLVKIFEGVATALEKIAGSPAIPVLTDLFTLFAQNADKFVLFAAFSKFAGVLGQAARFSRELRGNLLGSAIAGAGGAAGSEEGALTAEAAMLQRGARGSGSGIAGGPRYGPRSLGALLRGGIGGGQRRVVSPEELAQRTALNVVNSPRWNIAEFENGSPTIEQFLPPHLQGRNIVRSANGRLRDAATGRFLSAADQAAYRGAGMRLHSASAMYPEFAVGRANAIDMAMIHGATQADFLNRDGGLAVSDLNRLQPRRFLNNINRRRYPAYSSGSDFIGPQMPPTSYGRALRDELGSQWRGLGETVMPSAGLLHSDVLAEINALPPEQRAGALAQARRRAIGSRIAGGAERVMGSAMNGLAAYGITEMGVNALGLQNNTFANNYAAPMAGGLAAGAQFGPLGAAIGAFAGAIKGAKDTLDSTTLSAFGFTQSLNDMQKTLLLRQEANEKWKKDHPELAEANILRKGAVDPNLSESARAALRGRIGELETRAGKREDSRTAAARFRANVPRDIEGELKDLKDRQKANSYSFGTSSELKDLRIQSIIATREIQKMQADPDARRLLEPTEHDKFLALMRPGNDSFEEKAKDQAADRMVKESQRKFALQKASLLLRNKQSVQGFRRSALGFGVDSYETRLRGAQLGQDDAYSQIEGMGLQLEQMGSSMSAAGLSPAKMRKDAAAKAREEARQILFGESERRLGLQGQFLGFSGAPTYGNELARQNLQLRDLTSNPNNRGLFSPADIRRAQTGINANYYVQSASKSLLTPGLMAGAQGYRFSGDVASAAQGVLGNYHNFSDPTQYMTYASRTFATITEQMGRAMTDAKNAVDDHAKALRRAKEDMPEERRKGQRGVEHAELSRLMLPLHLDSKSPYAPMIERAIEMGNRRASKEMMKEYKSPLDYAKKVEEATYKDALGQKGDADADVAGAQKSLARLMEDQATSTARLTEEMRRSQTDWVKLGEDAKMASAMIERAMGQIALPAQAGPVLGLDAAGKPLGAAGIAKDAISTRSESRVTLADGAIAVHVDLGNGNSMDYREITEHVKGVIDKVLPAKLAEKDRADQRQQKRANN